MEQIQQKTPISLMNELCKANNIMPEYKVVEETGPPHQKSFRIALSFLNHGTIATYEGIGQTIKGGKHKAAQLALETSGLTKPERKQKPSSIAPSVELNSLAMKLGRTVEYRDLPYGTIKQHSGPNPVPSNAYPSYGDGQFKQYSPGFLPYGNAPIKIHVSLKIGEKEYFGEGNRRKEARHSAATNALLDLRKEYDLNAGTHNAAKVPSHDPENGIHMESTAGPLADGEKSLPVPIKSEISQVYEIASKRKLKIDFEVVSSSGPPHNRTFVTNVKVGDFSAKGEGPSKKVSKQEACVKILEELKELEPFVDIAPSSRPKGRLYNHGGYGKKTLKEPDPSLNPISLLGQIRQRRKEPLPVYTLVAEEGIRNKEFTMQVQVDSHTAQGSGANKKEAKKNAAEAMLHLLGIRPSAPSIASQSDNVKSEVQEKSLMYAELIPSCSNEVISKSSEKLEGQASSQFGSVEVGCLSRNLTSNQFFSEFLSDSSSSEDEGDETDSDGCKDVNQRAGIMLSIKKVHFYSLFHNQQQNQADEKAVDKVNASEGRQLPPGLLPILPEMTSRNLPAAPPAATQAKPLSNHTQQLGPTVTVLNRAPGAPVGKPMSEEILQNGSSPSIKKLRQLAEAGGFQVQYQDTTKESNEQCLAMVSITTNPPLISRGFGPSLEQAFENAAANALVHLIPPVPPSGPVIDHLADNSTSKASGQRNILMAPSEEPASGKPLV